jgi:hypothetical protein
MSVTAPSNMLLPREYILQDIEETLGAIKGTGDYHTRVEYISREFTPWNIMRKTPDRLPCLLVVDAGDDTSRADQAYTQQRQMVVHVWGYVNSQDKAKLSRDVN